ncbi:MAG: MaoC family dehydratase [Lachnospiraceae bacterium]|nr:MaoC family dehydratase [Lachnospiraceae bacterium]
MIEIGQKATFSKTIGESDIYLFAGITGDLNPLHVNEAAAKNMLFGKRIAHGMLTSSFISTVIASKLPGPGTIYMEQNSRFLKPVFIGDTITACVEVAELLPRGKARLTTQVYNQDGDLVVDGSALVKLPAVADLHEE